jgi:hypothetical protein
MRGFRGGADRPGWALLRDRGKASPNQRDLVSELTELISVSWRHVGFWQILLQ